MTDTPRTHRHGRHQQRTTVAAVQAAAPMLSRLEELYRLAADWSPGYGAGAQDVKVSGGGGDGSPAPPGTWQPRHLDDLDRVCAAIRFACDELVRLGVDLLHRSTDTGRRTTPGQGDCLVCGQHCSGVEHDRLRSGMCDACRKRDSRLADAHPGWDRQDRIRHMRARLDADHAEVLDDASVPMG